MGLTLGRRAASGSQFDEPEFMGSCTQDLNIVEYYAKHETERMEVALQGVPRGRVAFQLSFKSSTSSASSSPATTRPPTEGAAARPAAFSSVRGPPAVPSSSAGASGTKRR